MKEYRKIVTFTYKKIQYNLYLDKNGKRFFMKVNSDGSLSYLTDNELIEVSKLFVRNSDIMMMLGKKSEKINLIPKIMVGAGSALLTSSLLMYVLANNSSNKTEVVDTPVKIEAEDTSVKIEPKKDDYRKYISSYDDAVEYEDYYYNNIFKKLYIYNTDYIDDVLTDEVDLDDLKELIQNNDGISDNYKYLLEEYCEDVTDKYPNAELRMLGKNLESLEVVECSRGDMYDYTGSADCYGFYHKRENKIYVLEGNNYEDDAWARQVIYHELSHALRNCRFEKNDLSIIIESKDEVFDNDIAEESLNTLFALSLFDYEENFRAYQTQSNYYAVMAECIDYDFTDYVNKPLSDFPKQLNEYNGDDRAEEILELIKVQYDAYHSSEIEIDESEFDPIIDYLCEMYFKKYIYDGMSYDDAYEVASELEGKISLNIVGNFHANYSRIYDNLDIYLSDVNDYSQSGKSL